MPSAELQRRIRKAASRLRSTDEEIVVRAIEELCGTHDPTVIPLIAQMVKPPLLRKTTQHDWYIAGEAIAALEYLNHPDSITHLAIALTHPEIDRQMDANRAITHLWEKTRGKKEHSNHPAILALNSFYSLARLNPEGSVHRSQFLALKKVIEKAKRNPKLFVDKVRARKEAIKAIEKYGKKQISAVPPE